MSKSKFVRYKPKRWHPEFDLIVISSIAGKDNEELARIFGYTPQHISNILCTEQAQEIRNKVRSDIDTTFTKDIKDRLNDINEGAIKSLEQFFVTERETRYEASPFLFVDRAMRYLDKQNNNPNPNPNAVNNGTINNFNFNHPTKAIEDRMATALEKSMNAGLAPDLKLIPSKTGTDG